MFARAGQEAGARRRSGRAAVERHYLCDRRAVAVELVRPAGRVRCGAQVRLGCSRAEPCGHASVGGLRERDPQVASVEERRGGLLGARRVRAGVCPGGGGRVGRGLRGGVHGRVVVVRRVRRGRGSVGVVLGGLVGRGVDDVRDARVGLGERSVVAPRRGPDAVGAARELVVTRGDARVAVCLQVVAPLDAQVGAAVPAVGVPVAVGVEVGAAQLDGVRVITRLLGGADVAVVRKPVLVLIGVGVGAVGAAVVLGARCVTDGDRVAAIRAVVEAIAVVVPVGAAQTGGVRMTTLRFLGALVLRVADAVAVIVIVEAAATGELGHPHVRVVALCLARAGVELVVDPVLVAVVRPPIREVAVAPLDASDAVAKAVVALAQPAVAGELLVDGVDPPQPEVGVSSCRVGELGPRRRSSRQRVEVDLLLATREGREERQPPKGQRHQGISFHGLLRRWKRISQQALRLRDSFRVAGGGHRKRRDACCVRRGVMNLV